jgi:hypothetical protein
VGLVATAFNDLGLKLLLLNQLFFRFPPLSSFSDDPFFFYSLQDYELNPYNIRSGREMLPTSLVRKETIYFLEKAKQTPRHHRPNQLTN